MDIQESMHRVLESEPIFGDAFYRLFWERYPEVQQYFAETNMKRQAALLTTALILVERYYVSPNEAIEQYLQYLGTQHHERQIPRELYDQWREAMLEALANFHGDDWNDAVAQQWSEAIGRATELMFEGYDEHFTV